MREEFTVPGITKILIALRFYAVGCFNEPLGDLFGVSRTTASLIVSEVSYLIAFKLRHQYLSGMIPTNQNEILSAQAKFHRFAGFPLLVGAVDGTHIRVRSFGGPTAELYRNRKGYFSLNVQGIVSADVIDISFHSCFYSMFFQIYTCIKINEFTDAFY